MTAIKIKGVSTLLLLSIFSSLLFSSLSLVSSDSTGTDLPISSTVEFSNATDIATSATAITSSTSSSSSSSSSAATTSSTATTITTTGSSSSSSGATGNVEPDVFCSTHLSCLSCNLIANCGWCVKKFEQYCIPRSQQSVCQINTNPQPFYIHRYECVDFGEAFFAEYDEDLTSQQTDRTVQSNFAVFLTVALSIGGAILLIFSCYRYFKPNLRGTPENVSQWWTRTFQSTWFRILMIIILIIIFTLSLSAMSANKWSVGKAIGASRKTDFGFLTQNNGQDIEAYPDCGNDTTSGFGSKCNVTKYSGAICFILMMVAFFCQVLVFIKLVRALIIKKTPFISSFTMTLTTWSLECKILTLAFWICAQIAISDYWKDEMDVILGDSWVILFIVCIIATLMNATCAHYQKWYMISTGQITTYSNPRGSINNRSGFPSGRGDAPQRYSLNEQPTAQMEELGGNASREFEFESRRNKSPSNKKETGTAIQRPSASTGGNPFETREFSRSNRQPTHTIDLNVESDEEYDGSGRVMNSNQKQSDDY